MSNFPKSEFLLSDSISDVNDSNNYNYFNNIDNTENNEDNNDLDLAIDEKYKADLDILINLGYDSKLVKKIFIFLKPNDINDALDYMEERDGFIQHQFMEKHDDKSKCFICGNPSFYHIGYNEEINNIDNDIIIKINNIDNINIINTNNNTIDSTEDGNSSSNKNNRTLFICQLCEDEISIKEKEENTIKCGHLFCSECYFNYFKDKIIENRVVKMTCMQNNCPQLFDEDFIIKHLQDDTRLIKKYQKYKAKNDLYEQPDIKFCPIKDCESYARKIGDNKYVTCLNGHNFCFNCSKPWHGNKRCSDEIDKDFKKWKKNKIVKRCPKCRMWTEKNHGCNHMICAECRHQWCWLCGRKYNPGHYDVGGGCSGLQFTYSSCFDNYFCILLYRFIILIGQMLLIIFGFLPRSSFCYVRLKTLRREFRNIISLGLFFMSWIFWMIIFFILSLCLMFVICIPSLFYWPLQEKIMLCYTKYVS